jgi:hypothetical protein
VQPAEAPRPARHKRAVNSVCGLRFSKAWPKTPKHEQSEGIINEERLGALPKSKPLSDIDLSLSDYAH